MSDTPKNVFVELNQIDVSSFTEKKMKLTYLSWADAWTQICLKYPDTNYHVYEAANGTPLHTIDGRTGYVKVGVTVEGKEIIEYLAVMNHTNNSMTLENIGATDVIKTIQRCATKAIARHGLGMHVYRGEDLPDAPEEKPKQTGQRQQPPKNDPYFNKQTPPSAQVKDQAVKVDAGETPNFTTADKLDKPKTVVDQELIERRNSILSAIENDEVASGIVEKMLAEFELKSFRQTTLEHIAQIEKALGEAFQ